MDNEQKNNNSLNEEKNNNQNNNYRRNNRRYYRRNNNNNNFNQKKKSYFGIGLLVGLILIVVGISFIKLSFGELSDKKNNYYSFQADKNVDYSILLNDNAYYTSNTMPSGKTYPSPLIKNVKTNFLYKYEGDRIEKITYSYDVIGTLIGNYKSSNSSGDNIWTRDFTLVEKVTEKSRNLKNFTIEKNLNLDYQNYYSLVSAYEKEYDLPLNATLKVRMNIDYKIDFVDQKSENVKDYIEIEVPINNTTMQISDNYEKNTSQIYNENLDLTLTKNVSLIIGIVIIIVGIAIIIATKDKKQMSYSERYKRNINRVLKDYADLVVSVVNKPNIEDLNVLKLSDFADLIDTAEQNNLNILLYENNPGKESTLMVINNEYVFQFTVNGNIEL